MAAGRHPRAPSHVRAARRSAPAIAEAVDGRCHVGDTTRARDRDRVHAPAQGPRGERIVRAEARAALPRRR